MENGEFEFPTITAQTVYEEFRNNCLVNLSSSIETICPSCFNLIYKKKMIDSSKPPACILKCHRCGIVICNICKYVAPSICHVEVHKNSISEARYKQFQSEFSNEVPKRSFMAITAINNFKILTFLTKKEKQTISLDDDCKMTLILKVIGENIGRINRNAITIMKKLSTTLPQTTRSQIIELYSQVCLQLLLDLGISSGKVEETNKENIKNVCTRHDRLMTVYSLGAIDKEERILKRKRDQESAQKTKFDDLKQKTSDTEALAIETLIGFVNANKKTRNTTDIQGMLETVIGSLQEIKKRIARIPSIDINE
jgi:23S rRNA maturation mini-RNase III